MNKQFVLFLLTLMLLLVPSVVFASPIPKEEVAVSSITLEETLQYLQEVEEDALLDLGLIKIKKGLSKKEEPTFAQQKNVSAEGQEGVEVIIFVYYQDEQGVAHVTFQSPAQIIGASGIYNETILLDTIGQNYVVVYVQKEEQKIARQFQFNRKKQETKIELQSKRYDILKMIP